MQLEEDKVPNPGSESLYDQVKRGGAQAKESAATAIVGLTELAEQLEMRETAGKLRVTDKQLRSDTFNLIVMGRFKNGKSTLLNALMGGTTKDVALDGHKGPMVVDDLPATATLTAVCYADEPYVKAWGFDGKVESWSLSRYLRESTLDIDEQESQKRFSHIREFEMGFPARLCQAGVTVYDSPGLDEHESRTLITRDATKRCDAAVVVYRSDVLMGVGEMMNAAGLVADGTRIFTVVNLWGTRAVDARLRGFVWNKYVRDHLGGPKWDNQDLGARDIFFVNAALARDARYDGDEERFRQSRLAEFEQRLGEFLVRDRQHVHLRKFTTQASNLSDTIDKHIAQRLLATQADQEALREAYTSLVPKLDAIRARPKKLAEIFVRFLGEAQTVLVASFVQTVARIRQELPAHLEATNLPSGEKFAKVFKQKKLQEEAARTVSDFVTERVDNWSQQEANALLQPLLERLGEEIESEIMAIERQYDEIHFELTGWQVKPEEGVALVGTTERVLSAVAGLLLGDLSAAITGGAGGWRGAAGGISGALGTAFILGALGLATSVVFFPLTLAAAFTFGIIFGGRGFEQRLKVKVREATDPLIANLADEMAPKISQKLADDFELIEKTVTEEITAVIDEEERNIRQIVELNRRNQADRDELAAQLNEAKSVVAQHRLTLQQALTIAQQV